MLSIKTNGIKNGQSQAAGINRRSSDIIENNTGSNYIQSKRFLANDSNLTISAEGLNMLKTYQDQIASEKKEEDRCDDEAKIMEIARRIARGDKVPFKDEKKLMEYNSKLYQMAKAAAIMSQNKNRKEHDSMFKDEDNNVIDKLRELNRESLADNSNWKTASDNISVDMED